MGRPGEEIVRLGEELGAAVLAAIFATVLGSSVLAGRGEAEKVSGRASGQAKNALFMTTRRWRSG